MDKRRDKLEIIHDILYAIMEKRGEIKPTHILYKSNLSHQMLNGYLSELISKEFVIEKNSNGSKRYELTDKGYKYLEDYQVIKRFVNSYGLSSD